MTGFAGIVLAGGTARRLSGVDKPELRVGGMSLLARAVRALAGAEPVVVCGPQRPGYDVVWTREAVPGSGPVAALAAALERVDTVSIVLLAADLPGIRRSTVERLRAALDDDTDGVVLLDAAGKHQWLTSAWHTAAVRRALPADPANASLRRTLGGLRIAGLPAEPGESDDIDTPEDLEKHR
ncbi:molybdenum cofactor guanylyltransferase [Amycolatopsis benzoatilytica]|uniref:molybdenum cofactor guanylyltransferase n=1 Tax=Amycolatopsis benzoatilytica TaxID=346045 RepID=UPI000373AFE8|nr:NTP transferase domain-containing protein [Amycolatopsis benzoatilytica]